MTQEVDLAVEAWRQCWEARPGTSETTWPEAEVRRVMAAIVQAGSGGDPAELVSAGSMLGAVHQSASSLVAQLDALRESMGEPPLEKGEGMRRALDSVAAAATQEALFRLEMTSHTDALTGVGNRRALEEALQSSMAAARRQGHPLSVVGIDLDGLKQINDTEGHAAGDTALESLARAFKAVMRDEDSIFRVGGDEFVLLLPFTSGEDAKALIDRAFGAGAPKFSWGAANFPEDGTEAAALLAAADAQLYQQRRVRRASRHSFPRKARIGAAAGLHKAWMPAAALVIVALATLVLVGQIAPVGTPAPRKATNQKALVQPASRRSSSQSSGQSVKASAPSNTGQPKASTQIAPSSDLAFDQGLGGFQGTSSPSGGSVSTPEPPPRSPPSSPSGPSPGTGPGAKGKGNPLGSLLKLPVSLLNTVTSLAGITISETSGAAPSNGPAQRNGNALIAKAPPTLNGHGRPSSGPAGPAQKPPGSPGNLARIINVTDGSLTKQLVDQGHGLQILKLHL